MKKPLGLVNRSDGAFHHKIKSYTLVFSGAHNSWFNYIATSGVIIMGPLDL